MNPFLPCTIICLKAFLCLVFAITTPSATAQQTEKKPAKAHKIASPLHYVQDQHTPYQANWGPYIVRVETVKKNENDHYMRVRVMNHTGKVLREVSDLYITRVEMLELTGHAPAELYISCWTGGAYSEFTEVYFTREHGLRNILVFKGEDGGVREIQDVHHNGRPLIIADNPVLGDFSGYTFHRHFTIITILRWNGTRFADVTRHYPQRSFADAQERKKDIWESLHDDPQYYHEWGVQDLISAYYGNMLAIGRGQEARVWMRNFLPARLRRWRARHDREMRYIIATAARRRALVNNHRMIQVTRYYFPAL